MKKIFFVFVVFTFLAPIAWVSGGTINTCVQYQAVTVGSYIVQTDYWNQPQCPGTQCVSIDDRTGAFTVTKGDYACKDDFSVATYPSIFYGEAYGSRSPNSELPAQISSLKCVNSSWSFRPTDTGRWDAGYDIWVCPDHHCGPSGFNGGAEIMVWLDYRNTSGWRYDMGPVSIQGLTWEVWQYDSDIFGDKHKLVLYVPKNPMTSIENLDIKGFLDDCQGRGYIKSSWYLYAVEAGNEIHSGGIPFTSKSFSVSVNKDCGAKPVFTPIPAVPTATPDLTPVEIPPPP